jgi:uncharacterized protein (TIGR02266 family)
VKPSHLAAKISALREGRGLPASELPAGRGRILMLDDSIFFSRVLGSALENSGFQVLYARDVAEAHRQIDAELTRIDAFVVDLMLPNKSGVEILKRLASDPKTLLRPRIVITASDKTSALYKEAEPLATTPPIDKKSVLIETIVGRVGSAVRRPGMDLRGAERVPFFANVEFRASGREWLSGFSYDVSAGGLFVRTLSPIASGLAVELKVSFRGPQAPGLVTGVVAWSNPFRPRTSYSCPVGIGVRFSQVSPEDEKAIQKLVQRGKP